jgi:hypothetical protein
MNGSNRLLARNVAVFLAALAGVYAPALATQATPPSTPAFASYSKLPLSFEVNRGQTVKQVRFLSRGAGYSLFLTDSEAVLALKKVEKPVNPGLPPAAEVDYVHMRLKGARPSPQVNGEDKLPGVSNYFIGNDPSKWHTGIETFAKVRYTGVYPGVDLVYYGNQRQLEYDFVVAPGASPEKIELGFAGGQVKLDADGNLVVAAKNGDLDFHKPVVYQDADGQRRPVEGSFALLGDSTIGFKIGRYDHSKPLVIDPILAYSTYLGGTGGEVGSAIAVDANGNAYVTGETTSDGDFPTVNPYQSAPTPTSTWNDDGGYYVYVSKLNPTGSGLVFSTFLGGSNPAGSSLTAGQWGLGIALDSSDEVFVTGWTSANNFPTTTGAYQTVNKSYSSTTWGPETGFVSKLSASGSSLLYSTYLGGSSANKDVPLAIAVGKAGNVFVTGFACSADFPVTASAYQAAKAGACNAFVTKIDPSANGASDLLYSTFLGGNNANAINGSVEVPDGADSGTGIAVDNGLAYVSGVTGSTNFPVTKGALITSFPGASTGYQTGFVAVLNPGDTGAASLLYSTFLGGNSLTTTSGLAIDSADNMYVSGFTLSTNFPTTKGAYSTSYSNSGKYETFMSEIAPNGAGTADLLYSTYLGGNNYDYAWSIAVDTSGYVYLTGTTQSTNFPTTKGAIQTKYIAAGNTGYPTNCFVSKINPAGAGSADLLYSTYLGGTYTDACQAIATDGAGNAYVHGYTSSHDFPMSATAFEILRANWISGASSAIISKIDTVVPTTPATTPTVTTLTASTVQPSQGTVITFTATVKPSSGSGSPTGTVTFYWPATWGATTAGCIFTCNSGPIPLSGGTATFKVTWPNNWDFGIYASAAYSGDSNFDSSTNALYRLETVSPQTITFSAPFQTIPCQPGESACQSTVFLNVPYGTPPMNLANYATATSGLPVNFALTDLTGGSDINPPATLNGTVLTFTGVGEFVFVANQPGNANWSPAPTVQVSMSVNQAKQTLTFTPPATVNNGSPAIDLSQYASVTSGLPITYTLVSGPGTLSGSKLTVTGIGAIVVKVSQAGNTDYAVATPVTQTITVIGKLQTITFNPPATENIQSPAISLLGYTTVSSGLTPTFTLISGPATLTGNSLAFTGAGNVVVQASQAGNSTYAAATPVQQTIVVTLVPQTITFSAPSTVNQGSAPLNLAPLASASSKLTVSFTLVSGPATLSGTTLTFNNTGPVVVTANQAGNATYAAAPPVTVTITVVGKAQTITFKPPSSVTYGAAPINLATYASTTSGLAVSFTVLSGPGSISGTTLTVTGAGSIVVDANQAGNSTWGPASQVAATINVAQASQTITFTPPASIANGSPALNLSQYASASSGLPLTFTFVSGPGSLNGTLLTVTGGGSVVVQAAQAGNANYLAATSVKATILVTGGAQTITFTPPATISVGIQIDLAPYCTATSGLPCTFAQTGGYGSMTGTKFTPSTVGTVTIQASQAGNANYAAATPVKASMLVLGVQTITSTMPKTIGISQSPINLATYASASSGLPVTFGSVTGPATLSGATLTLTGLGTVSVVASQAGNTTTYAPAAPVTLTFSVTGEAQTVTFTPPTSVSLSQSPLNLATYCSSTSGLACVFAVNNGAATINGSMLTLQNSGSVTIEAWVPASSIWLVSNSVTVTITVTGNSQTITFKPPTSIAFGTPLTLTATASSGLQVKFSVVSGPATLSGTNNATFTATGLGNVVIQASQAGNGSTVASATAQATINVTIGSQTVNFNPPATLYYGASLSLNLPMYCLTTAGYQCYFTLVSGPATVYNGSDLSITGTGTIVVTASSPATQDYSAAPPVTKSIPVVLQSQTLQFTPPASTGYGTPINLSTYATATSGLAPTFSVVSGPGAVNGASLNPTGVGSIVVQASQAGNQYYSAATPVKATITVTPAVLTFTAAPAQVTYGQAIPTLTANPSGYVNGDSAATAFTGSPSVTTTATSSSVPGTYPITVAQGTLKSTNYTFAYVNGTLTVVTVGPAATPTFSPAPGTFSTAQNIAINGGAGEKNLVIYYTTDGTTPTQSSPVYPYLVGFVIKKTTTVKAVAIASGYTLSAVATATYTIN